MAELTQKDRENYKKLYQSAIKLQKATQEWLNVLDDISIKNALKALTEKFIQAFPQSERLTDINQLKNIIDLVDSYLITQQLFLQQITPNDQVQFEALESARQELSNQNKQIKSSVKFIEDEIDLTEDIEVLCSNSVILDFLPDKTIKQNTQALLDDRIPNLKEAEINDLTNAWGTAVNNFVEDARQVGGKVEPANQTKPSTQKAFASFFCIHNELEVLYKRLADTETVRGLS